MVADLRKYPLKATADVRTAIVRELRDFLLKLQFTMPKQTSPFRLQAAYDNWTDFSRRAMSAEGLLPAAAVLPDEPQYEDNGLTPRLILDTWSGGDPAEVGPSGECLYPIGDNSGDGFALFTHSEMRVVLELVFRGQTASIRRAIAKRLEEVFVEDAGLVPDPARLHQFDPAKRDAFFHPVRYGLLLTLSRYYDRKAKYTLQSQQLLDNAANAQQNRWIGIFRLEAHVQVCVLRRVRAMKPKVSLTVDEVLEDVSA